jgi:hypothetical protein
MKVEVTKTPKAFEPITLTITLETRDELLDMYVRNALKNNDLTPHIENYAGMVTATVGKQALIDAVQNSPKTINGHPLLLKLKEAILG